MTIPGGVFAPGGRTGMAPPGGESPLVPLEWLTAHPLTKRWTGSSERSGVGINLVTDTAVQLDDGYEGILFDLAITGKARGNGGSGTGVAWIIFVDGASVVQGQWQGGAVLDNSGAFDYLMAGDGMGASWGTLRAWLPVHALVQIGMRNNGGTADAMGWVAWGWYWPVTLRQAWVDQGWGRGRR